MSRSTRYSPELAERAVKMAIEKHSDYPSEWATFSAVANLLGMSPETLKMCVRRVQVNTSSRPGIASDERARLKELEREVKDLRRANAILQDASIFFATALEGQTKR